MNLITGNEKVTMTSLEIAELMNKNHGGRDSGGKGAGFGYWRVF